MPFMPCPCKFMNSTVIFGGAGYIGTNWARRLMGGGKFARIVLADIQPPAASLPSVVEFYQCDVRKPIRPQLKDLRPDWVFNFAAVHREPGHEPTEYFDTNLAGARNVSDFAE